MRGDVLQRCVAEFVGTFALVFVGAGSIAVTARPEPVGPVKTGLEEPRPGDAAAR